eukprot:1144424-Rhodomonas_salina.1
MSAMLLRAHSALSGLVPAYGPAMRCPVLSAVPNGISPYALALAMGNEKAAAVIGERLPALAEAGAQKKSAEQGKKTLVFHSQECDKHAPGPNAHCLTSSSCIPQKCQTRRVFRTVWTECRFLGKIPAV